MTRFFVDWTVLMDMLRDMREAYRREYAQRDNVAARSAMEDVFHDVIMCAAERLNDDDAVLTTFRYNDGHTAVVGLKKADEKADG